MLTVQCNIHYPTSIIYHHLYLIHHLGVLYDDYIAYLKAEIKVGKNVDTNERELEFLNHEYDTLDNNITKQKESAKLLKPKYDKEKDDP